MTYSTPGEYVNETTFLTEEDALDRMQTSVRRGKPSHLAAITDGLQALALKLPEASPHPPFFAPLFRYIETVDDPKSGESQLHTFLSSQRIQERADDDLTLLLAFRK